LLVSQKRNEATTLPPVLLTPTFHFIFSYFFSLVLEAANAAVGCVVYTYVYIHKCVYTHKHIRCILIHICGNKKGFLFSFHHACFIHLYLKA